MRHVDCIFEPDDLVEFRLLPSCRSLFGQAAELMGFDAELERENQAGQNVYVGAHPRKRRGGKGRDVLLARTVFVDFDDDCTVDRARRRIEEAGIPPATCLVSSGHGIHAYWRLFEQINDPATWKSSQQALIKGLQSDAAVCGWPQVMRVPAFRNHKPPAADCVLVEADPARRYTLAELFSAISANCYRDAESQKSGAAAPDICLSADSDTLLLCNSVTSPAEIISQTQPKKRHERNSCIMLLARGLKFDAGLGKEPIAKMKPYVRQWHERALAVIGTPEFEETWCDFARAWHTAVVPLNCDPIAWALATARKDAAGSRLPSCALQHESEVVRLLVGLCWNLANLRGDRQFFLSSHVAARALEVKPMTAWRYLAMLAAEGVVEVVRCGNERKATRYRWIGGAGANND